MSCDLYPRWSFNVPLVTPLKGNGGIPPATPLPATFADEIPYCSTPDLVLGHVVLHDGEYVRLPDVEIVAYLTTTKEQYYLIQVADGENEDWYTTPYDELALRVFLRLHAADIESWTVRPYIKDVRNSQLQEWLYANGAAALSDQLFEQVSLSDVPLDVAYSLIE